MSSVLLVIDAKPLRRRREGPIDNDPHPTRSDLSQFHRVNPFAGWGKDKSDLKPGFDMGEGLFIDVPTPVGGRHRADPCRDGPPWRSVIDGASVAPSESGVWLGGVVGTYRQPRRQSADKTGPIPDRIETDSEDL